MLAISLKAERVESDSIEGAGRYPRLLEISLRATVEVLSMRA